MSSSRILFFDWNGTFIDDEVQTVHGLQYMLEQLEDERASLNLDELVELHRDTFEIPLSKMHENLGFTKEQTKKTKKLHHWQKKYNEHFHELKLHEGVQESLRVLDSHNVEYGILSNHVVTDISKILEVFKININIILANSEQHEAHSQGKLHRIEKFIMQNPNYDIVGIVGDTVEEIEIAETLDTISIAITNGWSREDKLAIHNPDYLINSKDLPKTLESLLNQ